MAKGKRATFEAEEDTGRIAQIENNASPDDDDVHMRYYDEDLGFSIFGSRQQYGYYLHKPRDTDYYSGTPDYVYMMDLDRLIFSVMTEPSLLLTTFRGELMETTGRTLFYRRDTNFRTSCTIVIKWTIHLITETCPSSLLEFH
ncbi:hypothetical protein ACEPAI_1750 [Sanghuangporus weigelae]